MATQQPLFSDWESICIEFLRRKDLTIKKSESDGAKDVSFCEKETSFAPCETVSGLIGRYDYVSFNTKYLLKYFLFR